MAYNMSSSIIIGKLVTLINQTATQNKSTALPGYLALKFNPALINQIVTKNKLQSIIITGTNGKTTTAKLLTDILKLHHIPFIHNASGSNLLRGIASTLITQSNYFGHLKNKLARLDSPRLAIWEVDEAAVPEAIKQLQPNLILFTNLSRDQMDRYGEIDTVLKHWQSGLRFLPKDARVFINRNDQHLSALKHHHLIYFGKKISEADYFKNNIFAATALAQALKLKSNLIRQAVADFQPAFGRRETVTYQGRQMKLFLVKNPASLTAVWGMLQQTRQLDQPLLIVLNDRIADGTDVSWIWDVQFNYLNQRKIPVIVSGLRAYDLALRLKYAGLNKKLIIIEPNLTKALNYHPVNILPTYTAMLELRKIILHQKFS